MDFSPTSSTACLAGLSGAGERKIIGISHVTFSRKKRNIAILDCPERIVMTKRRRGIFPTCGLGGGQDEVRLSLIWELVDVDIVSASWQEVSDGDGGGCARKIWRCRQKLVSDAHTFESTPNQGRVRLL